MARELLEETQELLERAEIAGVLDRIEHDFSHELNAFENADEGLLPVERVEELRDALRGLLAA